MDEQTVGFFIELPYRFARSKHGVKRELRSVADRLYEASKSLELDQSTEVESGLGTFEIKYVSATEKFILFHSSDPTGSWGCHDDDVIQMTGALRKRLNEKNEQLNTDADRKIVVFGRLAGVVEREAIAEAVGSLNGEFLNVDEIYFCYGKGRVERYR